MLKAILFQTLLSRTFILRALAQFLLMLINYYYQYIMSINKNLNKSSFSKTKKVHKTSS